MPEETTTVEETDEKVDDVTEEKLDDERIKPDDDWQAKARKHERDLKRERKSREDLEKRLKDFEDRDKSEQEKALEKAREEAKNEVLTTVEKERRQDRLENASTRLAALGFKIGEGDDAQSVKFADPEDAFDYVERAIRKGDIDEADIFDEDGKVQTSALQAALADILDSKPHLRSQDTGKPKGNPDTRRGTAVDKDLEAMTPEDHARRKYPGNFK